MYRINQNIKAPKALFDRINEECLRARAIAPPAQENVEALTAEIKALIKARDAVLVAHFYVDEQLQALAEATGGLVSDSLDMAYFGNDHPATTLAVCGVRFMGETAKILTPAKTVLMPSLEATCSLDLGCPIDLFRAFKANHPDRTVVVYANTSAEVKAEADWVVTSGNAIQIVNHLHEQGEKILWAPDRHLGNWIQTQTNADMLCWQGHCVVHDEFKSTQLNHLMALHPDAVVIAHPESPFEVLDHAEVIGSTKVLIETVSKSSAQKFIVATDEGIFYKMRQSQPQKTFLLAPTGGKGATCTSCGSCPWMALNDLQGLRNCLRDQSNEITIDPAIQKKALQPIKRMLDFSKSQGLAIHAIGDA